MAGSGAPEEAHEPRPVIVLWEGDARGDAAGPDVEEAVGQH
jgi:hypothetical protein